MTCIYFLGVIVAHLAGQLYNQIFAKQAQFSTQMSVSGPAAGTGKSFMQTVGMLMFYGEPQPTTTTITEATFYDMLEDGNIYGTEHHLTNSCFPSIFSEFSSFPVVFKEFQPSQCS